MIIISSYGIKEKKLADSVGAVGSMLLLLVFLTGSLVLISAGASAYSRISEDFEETFSSSAAVRYVTNKLRNGNGAEIYNEGKAVVIDCGVLDCIIYSDGNGISERYVDKEELTEDFLSGGDIIFDGTSMTISYDESGLYMISAKKDGDVFSAYCRR